MNWRVTVLFLTLGHFLLSPVLSAQASTRQEIIIESVKITGAPHLPKDVRARLASQMRGREFEGTPDKWVGDLESAVAEAAIVRIDQPSATYDGYRIDAVCANYHTWHLVKRDASGTMHVSISVALHETPATL
jgi:hypothetical protein